MSTFETGEPHSGHPSIGSRYTARIVKFAEPRLPRPKTQSERSRHSTQNAIKPYEEFSNTRCDGSLHFTRIVGSPSSIHERRMSQSLTAPFA